MEQVPAVGLQVQAFAGRVGGDQDADRVLARVGVEGPLDLLAFRRRRGAVVDGDPLVGPLGALDQRGQLLLEITLCVVVLGEDDDASVVPLGRRGRSRLARLRQVGAHLLSNPLDQPPDPGVGQPPRRLGDLRHFVEQLLLTGKQFPGLGIGQRTGACRRSGLELGVFFGLQLLFRQRGPIVIGIDGAGQQIKVACRGCCGTRL